MSLQYNTMRIHRSKICVILVLFHTYAGGSIATAQLVIAHRGASHDAPENTLAAFRLAFEQGADGVEADFRLSRDGQIVCIHDEDTRRVAGKKLVVARSSLAELRALDVGSWKDATYSRERIPTLEEVIEAVPAGKMLFVELKTGPEIVVPLKKVLESSSLPPEMAIIISFKRDTLAACEKRLPRWKSHWLSKHKRHAVSRQWGPIAADTIKTIRELGVDGFGSQANSSVFDSGYVRKMRAAGIATFHVWTIDDAKTARFYQALDAYSITTNRPKLVRMALDRGNE